MQTLIIIFGSPVDQTGTLFKTLLSHKHDGLLSLTASAFLLRTSSAPDKILADLKNDLASTVSIFSSPSTGFASHGFSDVIVAQINKMLSDQITPSQIIL